MALALDKIEKAYKYLEEYKGDNPFIIRTRNTVIAYKTRAMNDFEIEYVISNRDAEPRAINKIVKVADWWGAKQQAEWNTNFPIQKIKITWLIGETPTLYHVYCIYRRSQSQAIEMFIPKQAILTDFLCEDWMAKNIDFKPYNERSQRPLFPYQEEAVKFLTSKKKAILADEMGSGKSLDAIVASLVDQYEKILIICPASLKMNWQKELLYYVDEEQISIVEGAEWKDNKYTIINYDILRNFYQIPTETIKQKRLEMDDDGSIQSVVDEKEKVSRKKLVISEAMANSPLYQAKFDLVIIDEAHRLSNTSSGIFKIVSDLVKRSNPKGIYALTGTPITNRPINFFNILKIIDAPIAKDWKHYVERYCDGKHFYNKKERNAHTAIFCRQHNKSSWYDLSYDEKQQLDKYLERHCRSVWVTNGASHLDELQEVVKSYYLRRTKDQFKAIVGKTVNIIKYKLTETEQAEYDNVWNEYAMAKADTNIVDVEKYKKITEGIILRQWLAKTMTNKTIALANKLLKDNDKIIIFTSFDEELNTLAEAFGEMCVVHNGKMTIKKKDESVELFQHDPSKKVFIGNIHSAGVGLTLTASHVVVFNSFSWVPGDNLQAEDRAHRLNQTEDVTIYYQTFQDTFYEEMLDKVRGKQNIIDNIIITEANK